MTATAVGRENHYRDPVALIQDDVVDFNDPLERAAIVMHRMTFSTPADAAGTLTGEMGREQLAYTWRRLEPASRQLWRHRADVAVQAHAGTLR